jgi:hypothetical protein
MTPEELNRAREAHVPVSELRLTPREAKAERQLRSRLGKLRREESALKERRTLEERVMELEDRVRSLEDRE